MPWKFSARKDLGMESTFYTIKNLNMDSAAKLRNIENEIQKTKAQIEQLKVGIIQGEWHVDQDNGKVVRQEKLKEYLESLEEQRDILTLGQGAGGIGSVLTVMLFGLAVRIEESRRKLEDQKKEKDACEARLRQIDDGLAKVHNVGAAIKEKARDIFAREDGDMPADMENQLTEVVKKLHELTNEKEDCQKRLDSFNTIGFGIRAYNALARAKRIVENDREELNNIPDYAEMSRAGERVEKAASKLKQDEIVAEKFTDPLLFSEEDKDILDSIGIRMELSFGSLQEALSQEKKAFEKYRPSEEVNLQYNVLKNQVFCLEENVKKLGSAIVPGKLSIECCNQIIEKARSLQRLPDNFKDLRSAREDIDNRALAFIGAKETGIKQDPVVMQQAVLGLRKYAEEFRKLEAQG